MGGLFGGGGSSREAQLAGIQVQTSLLGAVIPVAWGRAKITCNMIDYVAFTAIPQAQKAGKGGGGQATYTYTASIIMALCEGPISGVRTVYKDSAVLTNGATTALAQAGLSLATGTLTQAPWGYMTSLHPSHALGYSSLAYVYAQDYELGSGAQLANHSFEIDCAIQLGANGDADPKDICTDFLTNVSYGVTGWTAGLIGDLSNWSAYARANNLLLSPVLDAATSGADFLSRLAMQSNSELVWSEGVLKAKPYGDAAATGNGVTWTPDLTPVFDLTEDDFLSEVQLEIVDQSDAYNYVQIEYLDRGNQYQSAIAVAQDLDNIITYGLRKQDPQQMHDICDPVIAQLVAQLWLQRTLNVRDLYHYELPEDFAALEPMDYVTLTTKVDGMLLNRQLVLISLIDEDANGNLQIVAEGVPGQTASAAQNASHSSSGFQPQVEIAPGSVSVPALFVPPAGLIGLDGEVWLAAASTSPTWGGCQVWISADGTSYQYAGSVTSPARYGVLTAALASHVDPDNVNTLSVDLTTSNGVLASATAAEMNAGATLFLVDNEVMAYQTATLTAANKYGLAPLRRALSGTVPAAHAIGAKFVRLDSAIFKIAHKGLNVGNTMHVKLPSFNLYGRGLESLAAVTDYTVTLGTLPPAPIDGYIYDGGSATR